MMCYDVLWHVQSSVHPSLPCHCIAGKTLIARQIGKMLNGKEPKIVNGPEVLNKYVGASEENIRALFAEAEADQEAHKEYSELHVIIFDEIDAICKSRGSVGGGSGVHDTVVNQLLTKIDGVDSLNNILLIGMTNRKDMLDEALLRPGRLEVQVEIGLPDDKGRLQILKVGFQKYHQASPAVCAFGHCLQVFAVLHSVCVCKLAARCATVKSKLVSGHCHL